MDILGPSYGCFTFTSIEIHRNRTSLASSPVKSTYMHIFSIPIIHIYTIGATYTHHVAALSNCKVMLLPDLDFFAWLLWEHVTCKLACMHNIVYLHHG